jgi:hypothetical protein
MLMSANLVNSNTPMTTLGMLRTRKTRTTVPTIFASWRSRLLERLEPGLKNILKLRVASRKRGARPVVVRGWTDWYRIRNLEIWGVKHGSNVRAETIPSPYCLHIIVYCIYFKVYIVKTKTQPSPQFN